MRNLTWRKIDRYSKKLRAINYLGGKCKNCGENNFFKLNFHHIESVDKEYNLSKIKEGRWSIIENEIKKCKLLCYNCHFEYHFDNDRDTYRKNITKKTLLEYKGLSGCEICGYNKCMGALDFHHPDSDDKDFNLSSIMVVYKSVYDLKEKIENELDKCEVVCKNCHSELHFNDEFYKKNYDLILEKSLNFREVQPKIDREEVKKLYENGYRQIDISKHFKAKKGTISGIIKELGLR